MSRVQFNFNKKIYNGDKQISHFYCVLTKMNRLDIYKSGGGCNNILKKFTNIINIRFGYIIKFIKINNKQSLGGRYRDFLITTRITSERTTPYLL